MWLNKEKKLYLNKCRDEAKGYYTNLFNAKGTGKLVTDAENVSVCDEIYALFKSKISKEEKDAKLNELIVNHSLFAGKEA